jgi:hypothetical protein
MIRAMACFVRLEKEMLPPTVVIDDSDSDSDTQRGVCPSREEAKL